MANIYKKKYPMAMPDGAEIVERQSRRIARWATSRGQLRTAEVLADGRVQFVSDCWYIRYRDAEGKMQRRSTGCRGKQAARQVLADAVAEVERVKSGIITIAEKKIADQASLPLGDHVKAYLEHLGRKRIRGRKVTPRYCLNVKGRLKRVFDEASMRYLPDITREDTEKWLEKAEGADLGPATRNEYLTSVKAFCNWAVKTGRLAASPVASIGKADRESDRRRVRRALTAGEVARLLDAARRRPIAMVARKTVPLPEEDKIGRSSWTYEAVTSENLDRCYRDGLKRLEADPERRARLERLGRERALFYLLAVSTGLRRKELASLTVGRLHLDAAPTPFLELRGADAKNAQAANLPLRADVVAEVKRHLALRQGSGQADQDALPLDAKLFTRAPAIRVFDADLQAAGIAKYDRRGRVVDIHALRHTFGTHLSAAGVHPRTAMAAMRHSRIELTMNLYTDPVLLDVAGAVAALPSFAGEDEVAAVAGA